MKWLRIIGRWIGLGRVVGLTLLAAFLALRIIDPAPLETLRLKTFDLYQFVQPRTVTSNAVVVIDIDEASLKELGQWPWPRTVVADLISRIAQAPAAAVAFDILFAEPDRLSPARFAATNPLLDAEIRSRLTAMPDNEVALVSAFKRSRVVVGHAGHFAKLPDSGEKDLPKSAFGNLGGDPRPVLFQYPGVLRNITSLERAAAGRGLITIRPDRDGIIRRIPAAMIADGQVTSALSIELLRVATNASSLLIKRDVAGISSIVIAGNEIPTDPNGQLWVHFSAFNPSRFISAADVIAGKVQPERLRGKLVIIGTSAVGLFDLRATPLDRVRPGVDIHAEVIDNILTKSLLTRPHYAIGTETVTALLVGLLMITVGPMFGAIPIFLLGAVAAAALMGMSLYLFQVHRVLIDPVFPLASSLTIFVGLTFTNYVREELKRSQIRSAFQHYLSPELVEQLSRDPEKLVLGGERRELSILFSDVRGFTAIAESYKDDPAGLTRLMNRLLTPLSNAIIERQGTIDKYMGDAIMAFWNAPLSVPDHAAEACHAALEMHDRMRLLNVELEADAASNGRSFKPLDVGIGIATGMATVGNMGSDLRFDYSVLGDAVNLASRIEGLTRFYDVPILVAGRTAADGALSLATLEVDLVRVKGKSEAEPIIALLGKSDVATSPVFLAVKSEFAAMIAAYRNRQWNEAARIRAALSSRADRCGLDGVLHHYDERISAFVKSPPAPDWDGVFNMETK